MLDLSSYAVTPGRIFFGEKPEEVYSHVNSFEGEDNIDTSFSVMMRYSNGKSMVGHFGFNTEYVNYINILSGNTSISIEQFFTIPPDKINIVTIKQQNKKRTLEIPSADCFVNFLQKLLII